ncbi:MAG: type I methionyl aminopeptidase [Lachnospiraceae bacterium]|nr:type I methionyl aminopeptidase [Lachnospiraceae bacterium]MDY5742845.1 type I methionyl aminopeptidase [Lachnospiraceae bacterium]
MSVTIKSTAELDKMREAGRRLAQVHEELRARVKPGMSTWELDRIGEAKIRELGCVPNFLDYHGYPASICISVNDEVVHGIPKKEVLLQEGDMVSFDCGLIYHGYHSDAARTYILGEGTEEQRKLVQVTRESFFAGIKRAKAGCHLYDISAAIDDYISPYGYGIVRDLCGHGIGTELHEDPQIPNYRRKAKGVLLRQGMTLAIEPMVALGTWEVDMLDDGWTFVTADGSDAAHYENTIIITDGEPEILTLTETEKNGGIDICIPII